MSALFGSSVIKVAARWISGEQPWWWKADIEAKLLTKDEARRIAANIAKLPDCSVRLDKRNYCGARFRRMRCSVRRCMLRRRAVSETLRSHSS